MARLGVAVVMVIAAMATGINGHPFWRRPSFWQNWFCSHWFHLPWASGDDSSFETERIPEMRILVGTCTADVGRCPVGSCSTKSYRSFFGCPDDGYIAPVTETRAKDCGIFGKIEYQYIVKCGCEKDNGIVIQGTVFDSATNEPFESKQVWFGNKYAGTTGKDGKYRNVVNSDVRSIVVKAQDKNGMYMEAVKTVEIPEGFRGPVEQNLFMIKKAVAIKVDSSVQTTLSLSDDPSDVTAGNAQIEIPPNTFRTRWGRPYRGTVNVAVTFIETSGASEDIIPGQFLTPVSGGLENMISDGVVSFSFKDDSGRDLQADKIKFTVREGMTLWSLNTVTGLWEPLDTTPARRKRQVTLNEFLTEIYPDRWYNIDKIPGAPRCYFKARIYNVTDGVEIESSSTTSFKPEITAFTNLMQRLRIYAPSTSTPNETCYEVRCPVVSNPDDALVGFINMTATEMVYVGGAYLPAVTHLTPRMLTDYIPAIQTELTGVQYDVAPNGLDIFVNFVSDATGPFFTDLATCEASTADQPALHFFKPEPPSYEPVPEGTEICTARIVFRDNYMFYNYTADLPELPNVTVISVWEQEGTKHYYTDVAQMEFSTIPGENFVFACVQYRCSQENESTTVYLDIDIPIVNVTYNYTTPNGTVMNYTYSVQNFTCWGNCEGELCGSGSDFKRQAETPSSSIEGAFIAPTNVTNGPDFYNSTSTDCQTRLESEPFAYEFFCYAKQRERPAKK